MLRYRPAIRVLIVLATLSATPAAAQSVGPSEELPFGLSANDVARVQTAAMSWTAMRTYVGGIEADMSYAPPDEITAGECRAVAFVGLLRMRDHYMKSRDALPIAMRLNLQCGSSYRAGLGYDGLNVKLRLTDSASGRILYQGRWRGIPDG